MAKLKVLVTGASGMVGEGVLLECLDNPQVDSVVVVGRRPCGTTHPKLTEIIHKDFFDLSPIASQLKGFDACFFCLGVSSIGMKEPEYTRLTYTLTMHFAETVAHPGMVFCYVSGAGTDGTEKGRSMWARVKGKTENDLGKLPFKAVYNFRPAMMKATKGQRNTLKAYKYFAWMYPVLKTLFPNMASTITEVGRAMINVSTRGYSKRVLEVSDILLVARS